MSAEIILFSVSILFSCLGTSRSFWIVFYRSKILSKTNRTRVAYIGSSVVKALGLNSNLLLESMVRYPTKVERVIFLTRHIIAGPPPVGGGNFVSLIRKKLVLKNKEFSCVDGVSISKLNHGSKGRAKHLRRLCARAYLNYFFEFDSNSCPSPASFLYTPSFDVCHRCLFFFHHPWMCLTNLLAPTSTLLGILEFGCQTILSPFFLNVERTSTDYSILLHFKSPLADEWNREIGGFREFDVSWTG